MITSQYKKYMKLCLFGAGATFTAFDGSSRTVSDNPSLNANAYMALALPKRMASVSTSPSSATSIVLGDGQDAEDENSTKLSGTAITTVATSVSFAAHTDENGKGVSQALITVTNTGDSEITISEIGVCFPFYHSTSSSWVSMLADRTLLDTPVTLAPNEVGQITYTIAMD